jgi:6-phosphogluconolactonase (cycloisomerase 2 family)
LNSAVASFAIDANGNLSPIGTPQTDGPGQSFVSGIRVDPAGKYVYRSNTGSATVGALAVQSDGSLLFLGAVPTDSVPHSLAVVNPGACITRPLSPA